MKTCTACNQIRPADSFYRDGSWCKDCRTHKRAEWKARNPGNHKAFKMLKNTKKFDPTAYGKLHCEHIASYAKRNIERFERATNLEAPPELTAIYQLAKRLTDQQHANLIARDVVTHGSRATIPAKPRECEHCGKTYTPQGNYTSRWCSTQCRSKVKALNNPEARRRIIDRYLERQRLARAPRIAERKAQQDAKRHERKQSQDRWAAEEQRYIDLAHQAADMRRLGHRWQYIADTLGYSGTGAVYNSIRLRLQIDPRTLAPPNRSLA